MATRRRRSGKQTDVQCVYFRVSELLWSLFVNNGGSKLGLTSFLFCFPKSPQSTECTLIGHPHGVEPALVGDIPSTVAQVVNSKSVALSPITVNFANIVETGWVIVRRLKLLRLEHLVCVRKLVLSHRLFARSTAQTRHIGDLATVTCKDGHAADARQTHGGKSSRHLVNGEGSSSSWLPADHDWLLADEGLGDDGRLLSNNVAGVRDWDAGNAWLLDTIKNVSSGLDIVTGCYSE